MITVNDIRPGDIVKDNGGRFYLLLKREVVTRYGSVTMLWLPLLEPYSLSKHDYMLDEELYVSLEWRTNND